MVRLPSRVRFVLCACAVVAAVVALVTRLVGADGVASTDPFWLEDDYLSAQWTDLGQAGATGAGGFVRLPESLASDPSLQARVVSAIAAAEGVRGRYVYLDARYPHSWWAGADFASELARLGWQTVDAQGMAGVMASAVADGTAVETAVAFAQDIAPDTVAGPSPGGDALLARFLRRGGTVIWPGGDAPFHYLGHADGSATVWGEYGLPGVLGLPPAPAPSSAWGPAVADPTALGALFGLQGPLSTARAAPPSWPVVPLATDVSGPAGYAAWIYSPLAPQDQAATNTAIDTTPPGTLSLPEPSAILAYDPLTRVVLAGRGTSLRAWAWDGDNLSRFPAMDIAAPDDRRLAGAAFVGDDGTRLAVLTDAGLILYGWTGAGWQELASAPVAGGVGVARGVGSDVLVATSSDLLVYGWDGSTLAPLPGSGVSGFPGALGVSSADGTLAAVWTDSSVAVLGWDGSGYRDAPTWEPPQGSLRNVLGVAFWRDGGGYWVLDRGTVRAFAYAGSYVVEVGAWSIQVPGAASAAAGWDARSLGVVAGSRVRYWDWTGDGVREVAAKGIVDVGSGAYAEAAVYRSVVFPLDHQVGVVQVDLEGDFPAGTGVAVKVSTDGGTTWTAVAPCVNPVDVVAECGPLNQAVPIGSELVYELILTTDDPSRTPVVDRADVVEIASRELPDQDARRQVRAVLIR